MVPSQKQNIKRLLRYIEDTAKLSAFLFQEGWPTASKTRQLLIDQSRSSQANVTAIKLLHWDKEMNSIKYYAKRWWSEFSLRQVNIGLSNAARDMSVNTNTKGKVARVAFMISKAKRRDLSKLGYIRQKIFTD